MPRARPIEAFTELEAASDLDPASKMPWLRKAQIHFDARLYGQAITEAREVLQRDNTDLTAKSILAVSGLRVSADALDQLRKVDEVKGSTRSEAEAVAKIIREALGEPILLPQPAAEKPDSKKSSRSSRLQLRHLLPSPQPPPQPRFHTQRQALLPSLLLQVVAAIHLAHCSNPSSTERAFHGQEKTACKTSGARAPAACSADLRR